jgi:hypothetical protein
MRRAALSGHPLLWRHGAVRAINMGFKLRHPNESGLMMTYAKMQVNQTARIPLVRRKKQTRIAVASGDRSILHRYSPAEEVQMTPAPVIRLHPDDGAIARSSLPPGMVVADGVTTVERIPAGHWVAIKPIAGRAGTPLRPDHRLCRRYFAGPARVHTQTAAWVISPRTMPMASTLPVPNFDLPATLRASAALIGRGYAQLYRHPHLGDQRLRRRHRRDMFKRIHFGDNPLADFPNVDGAVALTQTGCGVRRTSRRRCCDGRSAATRGM